MSPTAVREIFNSCVCEPNLAAVFTHNGKHRQGITGKKSVTTNCKHWNAIRIKASPCRSFTAPITPSTKGHPCDSVSPAPFSTCKTHSSCRCRTSPCGTDDNSANGFNKSVCRVWKRNQFVQSVEHKWKWIRSAIIPHYPSVEFRI